MAGAGRSGVHAGRLRFAGGAGLGRGAVQQAEQVLGVVHPAPGRWACPGAGIVAAARAACAGREKSSSAKPTESNTVTSCAVRRPGAWPVRMRWNSVTAKSAGICWISPSMRDCGSNSTTTRVGAAQDVGVQLGLAGAVAAHGVEVHAGFDHLRQQDGGIALVGRGRGHDVAAAPPRLCCCAAFHRQARQPRRARLRSS